MHHAVDAVMELYVRLCSLTVTTRTLARAARFPANDGVDPRTGSPVLSEPPARRVNALMLTCGTYDAAGQFAYDLGSPVGIHAAGSGSAMAQQAGAPLVQFRMTERDVGHGVPAVVRVLDALRITSPSVGGPIVVYRLTADGAHALPDADIERVRRWAELENEALDRLPRS